MMEAVTIVIPVYNAEKFIASTINSVQKQTYTNWSLLIVNDGSTDNTVHILNDYAQIDSRIHYTTIANTGSAHVPRLTGICKASSKWVCIIDADDYIAENYLDKMLKTALRFQADIVCPQMYYISGKSILRKVPNNQKPLPVSMTGKEAALLTFKNGLGSLIPMTNGLLINKESFEPDFFVEEINRKQHGVYRDEVFALYEFITSRTVALSTAIYYYHKNEESVTHVLSVKSYDKLLSDIDFKSLVYNSFSDKTIRNSMDKRFLDLLFHRRIKYLQEKSSFDKKQQKKIEAMFKQSYQALNKKAQYSILKSILFVIGGFNVFKLSTLAIYFIKHRK
mgnify:FL=1